MKFQIKKNIFLGLTLVSLASFFFYERIFLLAVEKILSVYTFSYWGQPISFEGLSWEEKKIVMLRPSLDSRFSFQAEKIIFGMDVDFWEKKIFFNIDFYKPSWLFKEPLDYQKNTLAALVAKDKKGLKVQSQVVVHEGELAWSFSEGSPKQSVAIEASLNSHSGGFLNCYFNDSLDPKSSFLKFKGSNNPQKRLMDCEINSVNGPSFFSLAKFLKIDIFPFECTQGILNGQLKTFLNAKEKPGIQGEFLCSELHFENKKWDCKGCFKSIKFLFNKEDSQDSSNIASLEFLEPGFLQMENLEIDQMLGSLQLNKEGRLVFHMQGGGNFSSDWDLTGSTQLHHHRSIDLSMDLSLKDRSSELHLSINEAEEGKKIEIAVRDLKASDCNLFQDIVCSFTETKPSFFFKKGNFSTSLSLFIEKRGKGNLDIRELRMDSLNCQSLHSRLDFRCERLEGVGKAILGKEKPWRFFSGKVHLENNMLLLPGAPSLSFESPKIDIFVDRGSWKISQSSFSLGTFQGLMDIEWGRKVKSINLDLEGQFMDLIHLFPSLLQTSFNKNPLEDSFKTRWEICRKGKIAAIEGTFTLEDVQKPDTFFFTFEKQWKTLLDGKIPSGKFYAKNLCAKKIISPLLFRNGRLEMSGQVELEGRVDEHFIDLHYNAENLKIESEDLCMYCKDLRAPAADQFLGFHRLDLHNQSHQGFLPIKEATYLQKKKDLFFNQIQGVAFFEEGTVFFPKIEAFCEEVYFEGALDFDYSDPAPGIFNLCLEIPHFSGKFSQIRHLFLHFDKHSILHEIPMDAQVNERKGGMLVKFFFKPHDFDLSADIYGSLSEGTLDLGSSHLSLDGIYMNMEYHHFNKELCFNDIQGVFSVGQANEVKEYLLIGQHLICHDVLDPDLKIDLSLKDGKEELARFVGHTCPLGEGLKGICLDKNLSHISSVRPVLCDLALRDWKEIDKMEFRASLDFGALCRDLCKFKKTGIGWIHAECIKKLEDISKIEGEGILSVRLNPFDRFCYFDLSGHYGDLDGSEVRLVHLKGRKKERKWFLDELRWGDWSFYAEFEPGDDRWKIPFLGISLPESILLGMEGEIDLSRSMFKGKINLGELSLNSHLLRKEWNFLTDAPFGVFDFTGEVEWCYKQETFLEGLKGYLAVDSKKLEFFGGELSLDQPFYLEWELHPHLLIRLKDLEGRCSFDDYFLDFRDGGCLLSPSEFLFSAQLLENFLDCRVSGSVDLPSRRSGMCRLTDRLNQKAVDPLSIYWTKNQEGSVVLNSVKGDLCGCLFDLTLKEKHQLFGSIEMDLKKMRFFLPEEIQLFLNKTESFFSSVLEGTFSFRGDLEKRWTEMFSFAGHLKAYRSGLNCLEAELNYDLGSFLLRDLEFREKDVWVRLDNLSARYEESVNKWQIEAKKIEMQNVKFSQLQKMMNTHSESLQRFRFLMIKQLELNTLKGFLGDKESWEGEGRLCFTNKHRKDNPLFAIPAEFILRLGLDPHIMTPVTGSIDFEIRDQRFYLKRFKEMYSYAKGSKFHLWDEETPSWIDMNGMLSLRIRMRQYNLILKLIEPFIISIQGSLLNPHYQFEKQNKILKRKNKA